MRKGGEWDQGKHRGVLGGSTGLLIEAPGCEEARARCGPPTAPHLQGRGAGAGEQGAAGRQREEFCECLGARDGRALGGAVRSKVGVRLG